MITYLILGITVVVSMLCFNNRQLFYKLSLSPYQIVHRNEWYRLITHGFVHADWTHLIFNMFTFFSFGIFIEKAFQNYLSFPVWAYPLLYFGGMIVASVPDVIRYRNDTRYNSIGASGAVSAVLFASIFLNPWGKIYIFAAIPIQGILFGIIYLVYCQYMARRGGDNINHNAHFYGAIYGFIFPVLMRPEIFQSFLNHLIR